MARDIGGIGSKLLTVSVLALLGAAGCGKVGVSQNDAPSSTTPPGESVGTVPPPTTQPTPTNPGTPTNPSTPGTNPGTPNPPSQAIGDPATATANGAVLTNTATTVYNLNPLAVGEGGWRAATLLENDSSEANGTRVAFDSAGNGFAVWTLENGMYASRYIASAASWSAPVALDSSNEATAQPRVEVDPQTGNAIAAWVQGDGIAPSLYVSSFDIATNAWSTPQLLETTNGAVANGETLEISISGAQAAIAWRQLDGAVTNIYLSRLVSGTWTAPAVVDLNNQPGLHPEVAVDTNGNAIVAWRQLDGEYRIPARRWNNTTQSFGSLMYLDGEGDRQPRLGIDAAGNVFALYRGGGVFVRRYDVATDSWDVQVALDDRTGQPVASELAVDADGNAMAVWVQINNGTDTTVYVSRYSAAAASWGAPEVMETSDAPVNVDKHTTVSMIGDEAVIAWVQSVSGENRDDIYARKLSAGVWGPVTLLETREERGDELASTINPAGNAAVVWVQADGLAPSVYEARYMSSNFVIPNGATWQSLANTLYGVNSVEAGNALQAALGGITLSPGSILNGLPPTLSVTTSVPAYYTVLATDTWSHIAQTVYGVTDVNAIAQLRTLLGNPTLATGAQLVVPATFTYLTSGSYSAPLDWDEVNTTATTYHTLDTSTLTVPLDSWSTAQRLETDYADAVGPRVAFDASGNGIAVWTQASDLMLSRYVASTATWTAPAALDANPNEAHTARLALDRVTGNAIVSWTQSDGVAESMYVSSFDASTNSWSAAAAIESSALEVSLSSDGSSAAKTGAHAAVAWLQSDGTENNVYLSRLVSGTWTAPALIDAGTDEAQQVTVAIDANGNATVIWRQFSPTDGEYRINTRRWDNATQAYGSIIALDGNGDRHPRLAFDAQGNAFALWSGDGAHARRFNVTTGQWAPQVQLHLSESGAYNAEISVDAAGNALAAWMEYDATGLSTYARYYDVTTQSWGNAVAVENSTNPANADRNLTVSLVDGSGVVAWVHDNDRSDVYAVRFADGVWGPVALLESRDETPSELASSIDANDNATVVWIQADGAAPSVYQAVSNATPYYLVPAGATWRSIAAALYGVDSDDAAEALRIALYNPALTTGLHLQGLPATLVVTPDVPTYYIVQSGDTWASITLALYGTNAAQAATALQTYLSSPSLTAGSWLLVPSELSYTVPET